MLYPADSLMEMSKSNQAFCKQFKNVLSRTEFDRTKEKFSFLAWDYAQRKRTMKYPQGSTINLCLS